MAGGSDSTDRSIEALEARLGTTMVRILSGFRFELLLLIQGDKQTRLREA
jgi:hypothetical protein